MNWADTARDPWPHDSFLRAHGWRILSRPAVGPAIWRHASGREATEEDAIAITLRALDRKIMRGKTNG